MAELLAIYTVDGERHRVELTKGRGAALVLDRGGEGPARVVAELAADEGRPEAMAVLESGAYLARAEAGERGLCATLDTHRAVGDPGRSGDARAA